MRANCKLWLETTEKFYGEGPQQLLTLIEQTGSLNIASKKMNLSYKKALAIIKRAERQLGFKLLLRTIGGPSGGGSQLTAAARRWMKQYQQLSARLESALDAEWRAICQANFERAIIAPLKAALQTGTVFASIVGGGGKTTLQNLLWDRFQADYQTLYTTTTKMRARADIKTYFKGAPVGQSVALYDALISGDKAQGVAPELLDVHFRRGDYQLILCEADGSRGLPFKLHAENEPVIASQTSQLYIIVGCDAFQLPAKEAVHRYRQFGLAADAPLAIDWAIDYLNRTLIKRASPETKITVIFNKYGEYPLAADILPIGERFARSKRPLQIVTADLAAGHCYHNIEI